MQLAIPETVLGDEYSVERVPGAKNVTVPFYLDYCDFLVELQINI